MKTTTVELPDHMANLVNTMLKEKRLMQPIFICAWCMPRGIPGTHGLCRKCSAKYFPRNPSQTVEVL